MAESEYLKAHELRFLKQTECNLYVQSKDNFANLKVWNNYLNTPKPRTVEKTKYGCCCMS